MLGGLSFLLNGNMCVGVHGQEMIVRLAPEQSDEAPAETVRARLAKLEDIQLWSAAGLEARCEGDAS